MKYPTLYHIDENDNIRVWWMEQEGDKYRTVSGIENGQLVTSEWKYAKAKNVGRSNATTAEEQAASEIQSQYTKKRDRKYHDSKDTIGEGSKIIEPMLAEKFKGWDKSWQFVLSNPKLDGIRCIATQHGLFSRQGKPIVSVPHIIRALEPVFKFNPELILDGELYNHDLKDNFNEVVSLARQSKPTQEDWDKSEQMIQYHIYDMIGRANFYNRYTYFESTVIDYLNSPHIRKVEAKFIETPEQLDAEYAELLEAGYEGQMIRLDKPYQQKRSKYLLKRKEFLDEEFEVLAILEGKGNWSGYAKSVQCITPEGVVFNAGIRGTQEFTRNLLLSKMPKTATIRYQNKTPDGSLRFPVAVAFYDDKRDV